MGFVEEFKALRKRLAEEGYIYPSIRAFRQLVGKDYEEEVVQDNYYAFHVLRHKEYTLEYVDCYTAIPEVCTNITLYYKDEVVFYSPSE